MGDSRFGPGSSVKDGRHGRAIHTRTRTHACSGIRLGFELRLEQEGFVN